MSNEMLLGVFVAFFITCGAVTMFAGYMSRRANVVDISKMGEESIYVISQLRSSYDREIDHYLNDRFEWVLDKDKALKFVSLAAAKHHYEYYVAEKKKREKKNYV